MTTLPLRSKRWLSRSNKVRAAADAEAGLKLFREHRIDAVVTDLKLPGMSGLECTSRLKALPGCAGLPVVALSAAALVQDRDEALAAAEKILVERGAHGFGRLKFAHRQ